MHAHFERHVYHRHSHDTYSFGVTEAGAQAFTCRGAARTSAAGMVMAFNPDEPHDGHPAIADGFTYRIVHIGPELIRDVLGDAAQRPVGLPLFVEPVLTDAVLAGALRRLHAAFADSGLAQDEALGATVRALVGRGATRPVRSRALPVGVRRVRELLDAEYARDLRADDLAEAAGCSRYALHRGFVTAYGMAPSDYQRQVRLREARRLLATGAPPADAALAAGFADQAHLTRWFKRCYGVTPGVFQRP
ncbi:AraC family transcriptional regulator [Amycolatopsis sp. K13G38]|uniref:AraC family transcriptional regulator n=2 Tax=Amycolatopsis acididurans TaxID=2724524 RepID=A0ABX1JFV5_9PSEU|nr:AraC family transcriptional regulator [Amycolatopsis acididurans]